MIPMKLQLKNFLSYGPEIQTIDFSAYPLICLSGKNGHGKSALLDAITWALWGQARKTLGVSKADQGLLHLGQSHMLVILDFIFNDQTYRVRREFGISYGKATAAVDFGMIDPQTNNFISLTDKTIKQTQEKIERMLNLDMDSFINSAFLRQGQANEFSKKSAKDRKEVLATILGLKRYESLRMLASEKAKEALNTKNIRTALQEKRVTELDKKIEIISLLKEQEQAIEQLGHEERTLHTAQVKLVEERTQLVEKRKEYAILCNEQRHNEKKEKDLQDTLRATIHTWKRMHKQLIGLPDKGAMESQKATLVHAIHTHQQQLQKELEIKTTLLTTRQEAHLRSQQLAMVHAATLQEKKLSIEQQILEQKNSSTLLAAITVEIQTDIQNKNTLALDRTHLDSLIGASKMSVPDTASLEKQFEKRREHYQAFIAQGNNIKEKITELTQRKRMVHDENNPSCPLCEQNLSASRKRFLNDALSKSEQFLNHRLARLTLIITRLKSLLITQHAQLKGIKEQAVDRDRQMMQMHEIDKQITILERSHTIKEQTKEKIALNLRTLNDGITTLQQEYNTLVTAEQRMMQEDSILHALMTKVNALDKELCGLTYNKEEHAHAQQQLNALELLMSTHQDLEQQKPMQQERFNAIAGHCKILKEIKAQTQKLAHSLQSFAHLERTEFELRHQEADLLTRKKSCLQRKEELLQAKGSLENQKQKLEHLEREFHEEKKNLNSLATTIDDYQLIATATGKNGLQALLIEEAIPEIEHEANQLLGRLTNNQSHIIIESLRDLKKGGTRETLDIKISDAVGIRPYELFSGGEAFRIDFALRIAISKLLAHRAGTSLQTLIIDEGFGSQDEEGLNNIMEALYKIQDDFSKIIIVSHLPAMKDQFPIHFLVEKNAHGSHVRIMEQG